MKKLLFIAPLLLVLGFGVDFGVRKIIEQRNSPPETRIYQYETFWMCDNCGVVQRQCQDPCMWCVDGTTKAFHARLTFKKKPWAFDEWGWDIKLEDGVKTVWVKGKVIPGRSQPPNGPWN